MLPQEKFRKAVERRVGSKDLEKPPRPELGDLSFPCFELAAKKKKSPEEVAKELASRMKTRGLVGEIKAIGPYVNFFLDMEEYAEEVLKSVGKNYGKRKKCKEKALVEHTSINPNASPHVGRARNALIGDSLVRLLNAVGYKCETHYYVNDVGKQIAMLVYGTKGKVSFDKMLDVYVKVNKDMDEETEKEVFELLRKFEEGDKKTVRAFKSVVKTCIKGQASILGELGIDYDYYDYESDYLWSGETDRVLKKLDKSGKLFTDKHGRKVLDQKGHELPMKTPVLVLTRSDGTSLYALRDICYNIHKNKRGKDLNLVVLGEDQKLYQRQIDTALDLLGEESPEAVYYSYVLLKTGKMSTRKGNLVLLEDFMEQAKEKALKEVKKRHPNMSKKSKEKRAKAIGYGAVRYSMLKVSPEKNVLFDWGEALDFQGNSAPYLQYTHARAKSILRKARFRSSVRGKDLNMNMEKELVKKIGEFPSVVLNAAESRKPHLLANFLYGLANTFNEYYQSVPVLKSKEKRSRLALVRAVVTVMNNGLGFLGIEAPKKM